ncbi:MAG TPA: methyltransferase domain-containing protein, partial [Thermodesulfobacteriota bacterium]|nr:methyltransferase domain-containing protein [Thermodesulfobacteriota bacterium]
MEKEEIGKAVRERYGNIAKQGSSCCGPAKSCCGSTDSAQTISRSIGYTEEELKAVPEGTNLGLGCGNPIALASLKEGEVVLDLGSGAGFDCFLAAKQIGSTGKVIGVDMTAEMLERARENARKGNFDNVEFRLGEIENLP